jgi:hypothetical protein
VRVDESVADLLRVAELLCVGVAPAVAVPGLVLDADDDADCETETEAEDDWDSEEPAKRHTHADNESVPCNNYKASAHRMRSPVRATHELGTAKATQTVSENRSATSTACEMPSCWRTAKTTTTRTVCHSETSLLWRSRKPGSCAHSRTLGSPSAGRRSECASPSRPSSGTAR